MNLTDEVERSASTLYAPFCLLGRFGLCRWCQGVVLCASRLLQVNRKLKPLLFSNLYHSFDWLWGHGLQAWLDHWISRQRYGCGLGEDGKKTNWTDKINGGSTHGHLQKTSSAFKREWGTSPCQNGQYQTACLWLSVSWAHLKLCTLLLCNFRVFVVKRRCRLFLYLNKIMKVMPTRSLLPGTRCFGLSLCCDLFCPNCDAQIAQNQPKLCPNCSREKKNHTFFTRKIEIFIRKSRCFWKKKWKNSGKKKISVENTVFFRIKFSLPKNLFSSQLSTMDNSTCPKSPH